MLNFCAKPKDVGRAKTDALVATWTHSGFQSTGEPSQQL